MEILTPKPLPSAVPSSSPPVNHLILTATTIFQLKQIHAHLLRSGLDLPPRFLSKLLSFPVLSPSSPHPPSSVDYALSVLLHHYPGRDRPRLANRALRALARSAAAHPPRALAAYARLRRAGLPLEPFSFPAVLRAAARASGVAGGLDATVATREVHGLAAKTGLDVDPFVQTAVVGAYSALGRCDDARGMFDQMPQRDLVAWSVMLDGYCQGGCYKDALLLFDEMKSSGIVPDQVILSTVLSACGRTKNLAFGKAIHSHIVESNLMIDAHVQSSLINMYANCGAMDTAQSLYDRMSPKNLVASTAMVFGYSKLGEIDIARSIFDQMPVKDLVCWSAMISGYAESEQPNESLNLFNEMQVSGVKPDQITMLSVISACANLGALDQAKRLHMYVKTNGFLSILSVRNALIDMYSKCGSLSDACKIFDEMHSKNVITWTSMITGYAMHGNGRVALGLFERMKAEGVKPNGVTFVGLLYACSHAGLIKDGQKIFKIMVDEYQIEPKHEHYGCMVDLLGRAKLLHEALQLIDTMPIQPNVVIWGSILSACRVHRDVELGKHAANKILELNPSHDGAHVLLSNIYAKAGRLDDVREMRQLMKSKQVFKEKGSSWIELNGDIHEFAMGDDTHVMSHEIYEKLDEIVKELKEMGYNPDIEGVLVDLQEEDKRQAILLHSEKLALSLGLINSGNGSCIRIAKNLRVCEDCHTFMKLVSKLTHREIILRDRTRFHHFQSGVCTCEDFW